MSRLVTLRATLLFSLIVFSKLSAWALSGSARVAQSQDLALAALNQGRIDDAFRILRTQLSENPENAVAHQLLCRANYAIEIEGDAIAECEAAVGSAPTSDNYLWLGRAYGMKAARANPVLAFRLARKVVADFQRAVQLDSKSVAALRDLGEFYVSAPAIVGGGLDKAGNLANQMMPVSPTSAHRLLASIAEKKGDLAGAESELIKAVQAQPSPDAWIDVAAFYQRQRKSEQCVSAIQSAIRLDKAKDAALVDAAGLLVDANQSLELARQLLAAYLASANKSDDAPAAKVHVQLGNLLLKSGDAAGARTEFQSALSLASAYLPAQKALHDLSPSQAR